MLNSNISPNVSRQAEPKLPERPPIYDAGFRLEWRLDIDDILRLVLLVPISALRCRVNSIRDFCPPAYMLLRRLLEGLWGDDDTVCLNVSSCVMPPLMISVLCDP